ncbi:MAG: dienelactone hydrolase family protein [Caulobacterales bacterium]|nr:dienelactone hydrolase family protein [Caulobacterales bacterium]MCA0372036.1 dienelactone hydrolase family protein [Pseudomonadota bacterium]
MFRVPMETVNKRGKRLSAHFKIVKPDGDGPFPTIIMLHGCGRAFVAPEFANIAKQHGFASIIVDSFAPRNISEMEAGATVCTTLQLRGSERAGDLAATIEWALYQDWVDKGQIHAAGWSHGGWTIMDAIAREDEIGSLAYLSDYKPNYINRLKSIFCTYPWCGPGSHSHSKGWKLKIPAHFIICGRDFVVGDALTMQTIDKLSREGHDIGHTFFEKATHSFDERDSIHPAHKFDLNYTNQAVEIMIDFFKQQQETIFS